MARNAQTALPEVKGRTRAVGRTVAAVDERDHREGQEQQPHANERPPDVGVDPEVRCDDVHAAGPADRERRLEAQPSGVFVRPEQRRRLEELGCNTGIARKEDRDQKDGPRMIRLQISQPRTCSVNATVRPLVRCQNGVEMPLNLIRR